MLRTGADFLPQIQVAEHEIRRAAGLRRTDDDRATAGQQVRQAASALAPLQSRNVTRPGPGRNRSVRSSTICAACIREPRNRETSITTQGEHAYPAVTNDLDLLWDTARYRGPIVQDRSVGGGAASRHEAAA